MEEYDVADCFLNTPRKAVLASVEYRLRNTQERTRAQLRASPSAKIARQKIIAVVLHRFISSRSRLSRCLPPARGIRTTTTSSKRWPGADWVVLWQRKGLPIGGHLSVVYVELVALRREFLGEWPSALSGFPTARYRDTSFVAVKTERTAPERE